MYRHNRNKLLSDLNLFVNLIVKNSCPRVIKLWDNLSTIVKIINNKKFLKNFIPKNYNCILQFYSVSLHRSTICVLTTMRKGFKSEVYFFIKKFI